MIYDLKRSVDLRWLFDRVLHSSLDDLVLFCFKRRSWNYFRLPAKVHDYLCAWSTLRAVICGHGNTKITVQVEATPPPGVWTFWIGQWTLFGTDANFADICVCVCQTTRMVLLELIECSCVLRINSSLFIYFFVENCTYPLLQQRESGSVFVSCAIPRSASVWVVLSYSKVSAAALFWLIAAIRHR